MSVSYNSSGSATELEAGQRPISAFTSSAVAAAGGSKAAQKPPPPQQQQQQQPGHQGLQRPAVPAQQRVQRIASGAPSCDGGANAVGEAGNERFGWQDGADEDLRDGHEGDGLNGDADFAFVD